MATQEHSTTYVVGAPDNEGDVLFSQSTFADCADITVRHLVNLLTYSNNQDNQKQDNQKWNLILENANIEDLNEKLQKVVDAINGKENKKAAPFYDLKTRLQMFFLYQRGFTKESIKRKI